MQNVELLTSHFLYKFYSPFFPIRMIMKVPSVTIFLLKTEVLAVVTKKFLRIP